MHVQVGETNIVAPYIKQQRDHNHLEKSDVMHWFCKKIGLEARLSGKRQGGRRRKDFCW